MPLYFPNYDGPIGNPPAREPGPQCRSHDRQPLLHGVHPLGSALHHYRHHLLIIDTKSSMNVYILKIKAKKLVEILCQNFKNFLTTISSSSKFFPKIFFDIIE